MSPTEIVRSARLILTPLEPSDAAEMVGVLSDPALYTFTSGDPPTPEELDQRYRHQVAGGSGDEVWHNWIIRQGDVAIGYVQATVAHGAADLAWVVGTPWQGSGYATEAAAAMRSWLEDQGIRRFTAHIHPGHSASQAVASRLGLRTIGAVDDDGEAIWASAPESAG
jgi:RimJ/RimL family protein N-acetyltransferase